MSKTITVSKEDLLLNYLLNTDTGYKRNKLKSLLKNECISVNGIRTSKFDYPIKENDIIIVDPYNKEFGLDFDIIFEDQNLLVINKPAGILSTPFEPHETNTAYHLVHDYMRQTNVNAEIYTLHRLDQGTSGVLMFAKNTKTQNLYQAEWNNLAQARIYLAYVEGIVSKDSDTIKTYLNTDNSAMVFSARTGKEAISHYSKIKDFKNNSILKVKIDTGRQNQIRVHLKDIGHPIVGDKKYGAKTNPIKRLGLHAYQLKILDPVSKKMQTFTAQIPKEFGIKKV